jgi:predicted small metal-binding protein
MKIEHDVHMKRNTSWQTSQYECGTRIAPHRTQTVEPIVALSAIRSFVLSGTKLAAETEEELLKNAAEHAVKDHGYTEQDIMTPEMKEKIKSHIRKSSV